jgi:hypothetical protein
MREEKRENITRRFSMPGLGEAYSIQDILDSAETEDEMLLFKDRNGTVWEIVKEGSDE